MDSIKNIFGGDKVEQTNKPTAPEGLKQNPDSNELAGGMGGGGEAPPVPDVVASEEKASAEVAKTLEEIENTPDVPTPEAPAEEKGPDQAV